MGLTTPRRKFLNGLILHSEQHVPLLKNLSHDGDCQLLLEMEFFSEPCWVRGFERQQENKRKLLHKVCSWLCVCVLHTNQLRRWCKMLTRKSGKKVLFEARKIEFRKWKGKQLFWGLIINGVLYLFFWSKKSCKVLTCGDENQIRNLKTVLKLQNSSSFEQNCTTVKNFYLKLKELETIYFFLKFRKVLAWKIENSSWCIRKSAQNSTTYHDLCFFHLFFHLSLCEYSFVLPFIVLMGIWICEFQ